MATLQLDHLILLLPHKDLIEPPLWLTENFTITPGGRHAGGKTENKLIVFRDGTYIELIAFIDDDKKNRSGHWWGDKKPGLIDYALTTPAGTGDDAHKALVKRIKAADTGFEDAGYRNPQAGGRTMPSGEEIKWKVAFPEGVHRGEAPFFCYDVTPRNRRVPSDDTAATTHPSGAVGIFQVTVLVPAMETGNYVNLYSAIMDKPPKSSLGAINSWPVEMPNPLDPVVEDPSIFVEPLAHVPDGGDGDSNGGGIAKVALRTNTNSAGWPRPRRVLEKVGGQEICILFFPDQTPKA